MQQQNSQYGYQAVVFSEHISAATERRRQDFLRGTHNVPKVEVTVSLSVFTVS